MGQLLACVWVFKPRQQVEKKNNEPKNILIRVISFASTQKLCVTAEPDPPKVSSPRHIY